VSINSRPAVAEIKPNVSSNKIGGQRFHLVVANISSTDNSINGCQRKLYHLVYTVPLTILRAREVDKVRLQPTTYLPKDSLKTPHSPFSRAIGRVEFWKLVGWARDGSPDRNGSTNRHLNGVSRGQLGYDRVSAAVSAPASIHHRRVR